MTDETQSIEPSPAPQETADDQSSSALRRTGLNTAAGSFLPDDPRFKEANRRLQIVEFSAGKKNYPVAVAGLRKIGIKTSEASISRYLTAYKERGFDGLFPKTEECGRKSEMEILLQDVDFKKKLEEIYVSTIGTSGQNMASRARRTGRRMARMATALTAFAEEPECPEPLAAKLRRGKFPAFLKKHLRTITPEVEQRILGAKHFQLNGITSRRDLTLRFPNGDRAEMPAGFKWVFDDMSVNQPFWCEADGKILFSRQGLYAIDHRSLKWLGKMLVARPREAYRAEDILRFLRGLFLAFGGKPDVIVFEQGIWKARKIHGFKLNEFGQPVEDVFERGEMVDGEKHLLTDGLAAIGIKVIFATSAHGKIIETCFNPLQTQIAIRTREFVNIGRHAGEFEIPGKRLARVRYDQADGGNRPTHAPSFLGFAPMNVLSDRIDEALAFINAKENSRKEIPDEIWAADIAKRPLLENQRNDAAVFLPEIRERVIDGGRVTVTVNGRQHDFREPWMIELGSGYKVFCRFDPAEPSRGAAIYNRETANNINGLKHGQFIGFAAWEMPAPAVDVVEARGITGQPVAAFYGEGALDHGDSIRKKQNKLVATAFSALPRPGQPAVKLNEIRDGEGRVARVSISGAANEAEKTDMPALAPVAAAPVQPHRRASAREVTEHILARSERPVVEKVDQNNWL
ncbi:MAG TPA: hypothetical protein VHG71_02185 [Verrucomicrobiae bacterium]|nr:hypothetical protein [Verrucomicrobiae bacterium]